MMFNRLFDAGNVAAQAVVTTLHFTELIIEIGVLEQQLFVPGIQAALLGDH